MGGFIGYGTDRDVRTGASGMSASIFLPLPPGEGEGADIVLDVNACRGLVAQHLRRFSVWPRKNITLTPGIGVKRVNRASRWLFVIRGHRSLNRITPLPLVEGLGGEGEASTEPDAEVTQVL